MLNMQAAEMPAMLSANLTLVVEFFWGCKNLSKDFYQMNLLCLINEEVINVKT